MKRKHHEIIMEWIDGAEIEFKAKSWDLWEPAPNPSWMPDVDYRVKLVSDCLPKSWVYLNDLDCLKLWESRENFTDLSTIDFIKIVELKIKEKNK